MNKLHTFTRESITRIHGITKNSNAIVTAYTPFGFPSQKILMSRNNFNQLMGGKSVTGAVIVDPNWELPILKTLTF